MPFSTRTDTGKAVRAIQKVGTKILYASATALNVTAQLDKEAQQQHNRRWMVVRRPKWVDANVRIPRGGKATVNRLRAIVRMQQPGSKGEMNGGYSTLAKFQHGGEITAADQDTPFAIPTKAIRPKITEIPPRALLPHNLGLAPYRQPKGDFRPTRVHYTRGGTAADHAFGTGRTVKQWKGKRRTFILDPREHFGVAVWGVYQRTGPGRSDFRLIWTLRRALEIPDELHFYLIAQRTARHIPQTFHDALVAELRGRGRRT